MSLVSRMFALVGGRWAESSNGRSVRTTSSQLRKRHRKIVTKTTRIQRCKNQRQRQGLAVWCFEEKGRRQVFMKEGRSEDEAEADPCACVPTVGVWWENSRRGTSGLQLWLIKEDDLKIDSSTPSSGGSEVGGMSTIEYSWQQRR